MYEKIKNYIKTKPWLYDVLNANRPINDDLEKWLNAFSKNNHGQVNFIQIGASDGLRWDPFRRFILRDRWSGVFVEPLPIVFSILKSNYAYVKNQKFKFINAAISTGEADYIEIWSYSEEFCDSLPLEDRLYYLRKSSLDKRHVEASLQNFDNVADKIICFRVNCLSINDLMHQYFDNNDVDIILIDAEGHDDKIVRTIDFEKHHPRAIVYEAHNLGSRKHEMHDFLNDKGYTVSDIGGDSVAVRS